MTKMNDSNCVSQQYSNDNNLSIRIKLHAKHSTSKISVHDWFFSYYSINKPCRILELGCGNAVQWTDRVKNLPCGTILVLSDLSKGMVETTWKKFRTAQNVIVQKIDIQDIPFADESFDIVIANHMLYHVPDIKKALSEVRRVLSNEGAFFSSTNGNGGMRPYLHEKLKRFNSKIDSFKTEQSFTIQNGLPILQDIFKDVQFVEYEDSLRITETQDLVDWIKSTITFASFEESDLDGLYDFFEKIRLEEGTINIPKEMGMFISKK